MAKTELNAVITQRIEVAPGLAIMRVVPDGWELPDFTPGQFAVMAMPGSAPRQKGCDEEDPAPDPDKLIKRAYSIASSSVAKEYMEFYVALVPSGALTPRLFALEPGDKLWLGPKFTGMFTLDQVPEDKFLVFLATGTGLAPYMSMMRAQLPCGGPRKIAILHGARHSWDLGYRSELMTMRRMCDNFCYVPIISRPQAEAVPWKGQAGYLQDLWTRGIVEQEWGVKPTPENTHVFLCGNPSMIVEMETLLQGEGYKEHTRREPGQIHVEKYW